MQITLKSCHKTAKYERQSNLYKIGQLQTPALNLVIGLLHFLDHRDKGLF